MCLRSKWVFPKKAKEDIVCYKVLSMDLSANFITPVMSTIVDIRKPLIAKGCSFHFLFPHIKGKGYIHTYTNDYNPQNRILYKCIIPKGTKYHESTSGNELCSKKIIFVERVVKHSIWESILK